jgi:alkylation response protein AidB-like acyl-CoA dehydrogenase
VSNEEILQRVETVAANVLFPKSKHYDETGEFPIENIRALGAAGLMGMLVPKEYGGLGLGYETYLAAVETVGRACASTAMILVMHHTQYVMIVTHGTEQQKEFFLRAVARGECLIASGTTEPETGGNADFCASAKRIDGDSIVISARKPVVTSAINADWVFVTTRASPEAAGNVLSIVAVPGLAGKGPRDDLKPFGVWDCVGMRATGSSGLELVETRVPLWHQIGADDSRAMRSTTMNVVARAGYSAVWLGIAQAALDTTVSHLTRRTHQFLMTNRREGREVPGEKPVQVQRTLAEYETVQRQVAEMRVRVESARSMLLATGRLIDRHAPNLDDADGLQEMLWASRITCSETAIDVCRIALRLSGVTGLRRGVLPLERYMRDALTAQVMAQAEDLAKISLGKKTLGLV